MKDSEVRDKFLKWLALVVAPVVVINARESGKRPATPYVMAELLSTVKVRENEQYTKYSEDEPSERVLARPINEMEWHFSVFGYGGEPSDVLRPLLSAAQLAQVNEPMMPGVIVHRMSLIRQVPEWVNAVWEPRAQMDVYLRGLTDDGHLIDTIETYEFDFNRV